MPRNFSLSAAYEYRRSHFYAPRTQREAGIEHLEWESLMRRKLQGYVSPFGWVILGSIALWLIVGYALYRSIT